MFTKGDTVRLKLIATVTRDMSVWMYDPARTYEIAEVAGNLVRLENHTGWVESKWWSRVIRHTGWEHKLV